MDGPGFNLQRFAVYGSSGNDILYADSSYSYVFAYGGNDTIRNVYYGVTIDAGTGNDSVYNDGYYAFIDAGTGNDTIYNAYVNYVTVLGSAGNDSISNYSAFYSTVDAGTGNDTIIVPFRAWQDSISGSAGDDRISLGTTSNDSYNGNNTIAGSAGNDTIYGNPNATVGNVYQYFYGDGYDVITNWNAKDTLSFGSGIYYTRSTVGSNVLLGIVNGSGSIGAITLSGASGKTINISGGNPTIISNNVYGTSGKDYLSAKASKSSVIAYGGNDSIYNGAWDSVTIDAGDGDDTVTNYWGYDVSINGGAGNDKISLASSQWRVTVKGGTGNDTLYGSTSTGSDGIVYQYNVGDGYDSITNWRSTDTVRFGSDVYYTRSTVGSNVLLGIVNGNSSIGAITLSGASGKTINISGGNPTIVNSVIYNYNKNSLVSGSSANDTIFNYAGGATLRGNGGNDYIYNSTSSDYTVNGGYGYVTIDGGDGNDTIKSYDPRVSISGGTGADLISVRPSNFTNVTINGGIGNDTIYGNSVGGGILYQYKKGDGNDLIYYFSANDTLSISGGSYTTTTSGNNILVNIAGTETITLQGAKGMTPIIYPKTSPVFTNYNKNSLVSGSSANDTIFNYAGGATLRGNGGNDYIYNSTSSDYTVNGGYGYVTIDGGDGNDTIKSYDPRVSISGGAGADLISLKSWNSTDVKINAGTGNDTIYGDSLGGILYQYKKGDGNDIIYNYSATDSITITGGGNWSTVTSGNNVIVNVAGSGNMTLVGAKGKTLNIYPEKSPDPDPTPTGVTEQDVIKKFMKVLDTITSSSGEDALNTAISVASGGKCRYVSDVITDMVNDCRTTNNATKFLSDKCGIILTNDDTGAITGSDAGGSTTKTAKSVVPETGSINNFTGSTFKTSNGLTVQLATAEATDVNWRYPKAITYGDLTGNSQRYIWQAFQTWWAEESLDLIAESYGNNYGFSSASSAVTKKLNFGFFYEEPEVTELGGGRISYNWTDAFTGYRSAKNELVMAVNLWSYNGLTSGGNPDGASTATLVYKGKTYSPTEMTNLDRILAHEMTHAVMMANSTNIFWDLPQFITEGTAELTHGIDDERTSTLLSLAGNSSKLSNSLAMTGGTGDCPAYAGGYMFLRYFAKQVASGKYKSGSSSSFASSQNKSVSETGTSSSGVSIKNSVLTVTKDFSDSMLDLTNYNSVKTVNATATGTGIMIIGNKNPLSISAGAGADSIFANVGNDTLSGSSGNDILYGEAGNDVIKGDAGDDSLNGGTGNDTLTGGDGKNVFIFGSNSGNDVITDYTPGHDKIKLLDGKINSSSISGSDVVLSGMMTGTITIKGGKDKKITVIDGNGTETTKIYDDSRGGGDTVVGGKTLTVTKTPVTLSSSYTNADASAMTKAVKITGNDAANSIVGGSRNDSLYGASGNDSLLGKAGNDKIYGQGGNDFLWGESGNDTLFGGDGNDVFIYSAGKDVIADFTVGDKISLGAAISKSSVKGSDVIFTIGSGSLTVKDGKGKSLSLIDKSGKESSTILGGSNNSTLMTVTNSTKSPVTIGSSVKTVDASKRTSAVKITGNDLANSIVGGSKNDSLYGGKGNDTLLGKAGNDKIYGQDGNDILYGDAGNDSLWGGQGNDTLFGGAGNDVFIYDAGKDVICGFETGDMLQITGTFTGTYNKSSKTISIKVGSTANAITLTDFTATTFNINGDSYGISGTKLVKK